MIVDSKIDEELKEIKYLSHQQERKIEAIMNFLKYQVDEQYREDEAGNLWN